MSKTVGLQNTANGQVICLPAEFSLPGSEVSVRRQGNGVVLEPVNGASWPVGFFEAIRITDPAFERPVQGELPPVAKLD
jgi:virulence-associated protein VagC